MLIPAIDVDSLTRSQLMADLDVVVGEQAYKCALPRASDSGQQSARSIKKNGYLHEPAARDTHERDDNIIFAQLVDLSDASVCHRECRKISTRP